MTTIANIDMNLRANTTQLDEGLSRGKKSVQQYLKEVDQFNNGLGRMNPVAQAASNGISNMTGGIIQLGSRGALVGGLAAGVGLLGVKAAQAAMDLERTQAQYKTLLGSAEAGEQMAQAIQDLAGTTPLNLEGAQQAANTLLQFGVEGQSIIPTLKMLGDATGGDNERFKAMALAFGQVSAAGRLMGQDVLQMINAGFNPLQEISTMTGESMIDLKKRMEDGGVSTAEVARAFEHATGEGGRLHGMMDEMANTTAGRFEVATSGITEGLQKLGQAIEPITNVVAALAGGFATLFGKFADGARLISAMAADILTFDTSFTSTNELLDDFNKASATGGTGGGGSSIAASAAAAAQSYGDVVTEADRARHAQYKLLEEQRKVADAHADALMDRKNAIADELKVMREVARQRAAGVANPDERSIREGFDLELDKTTGAWNDAIVKMQAERAGLEQAAEDFDRGQEIMRQFEQPVQQFGREVAALVRLRRTGAIDQATFDKATRESARDSMPGMAQLASSITEGSAEAYQKLAQTDADNSYEKQVADAAREQVRLQERIATGIEKMPKFGKLR